MNLGLRIDVDTLRGTRIGVPNLIRQLGKRDIRATFFFSVGPDNMGRHLFRLLKPAFAYKMLRTKAASLYGWDIVFRGTIWPGPIIGDRCRDIIRQAAEAGHEIGLHAWDHHHWQKNIDRLTESKIIDIFNLGCNTIAGITGKKPTCFASPGWRANDMVIEAESRFEFHYASDCRGVRPFQPVVGGKDVGPAQIPVTLPTYDEVVGRGGMDAKRFVKLVDEELAAATGRDHIPVLTLHAEVEGIMAGDTLNDLLDVVDGRGYRAVTLGELLTSGSSLPRCCVESRTIPGREGVVAVQGQPITEQPSS